MFGFSAGEVLLIALIALLLFGNEKLPHNMKKFLNGWKKTKKVVFDLQKSWHEVKIDLTNDIEKYDEKSGKTNAAGEGSISQIAIKPVHNIVSQEEIDAHQFTIENEHKNEKADNTLRNISSN